MGGEYSGGGAGGEGVGFGVGSWKSGVGSQKADLNAGSGTSETVTTVTDRYTSK